MAADSTTNPFETSTRKTVPETSTPDLSDSKPASKTTPAQTNVLKEIIPLFPFSSTPTEETATIKNQRTSTSPILILSTTPSKITPAEGSAPTEKPAPSEKPTSSETKSTPDSYVTEPTSRYDASSSG